MGKCVFCGILSNNKKKVTLHRFPRDEPLRKEWLKLIGLEGLNVRDSTLLCSDHFTKDCFIEYHCNQKRVKLGRVPTILKKEARFQNQHRVLVETNDTDKAQDVDIISDKENCDLRQNVLMEINSSDNDVGPASIVEQVPEASVIIEYTDSPTTSKEILSQEECFSLLRAPNKTDALKRKYQCVTAHEKVSHDHCYDGTPHSMRRQLNALCIKLDSTAHENKILKQALRRLKAKDRASCV